MKLEAAKEMDRRCVLNWLNEVYVTPSRAFNEYTDDEIKMFAHDALVLLNEQEAVKPILEQDSMVCGVCGHEVIWQKMLGDGIWADEELDYCPHCGRQVKWDDKW